MVSGNLIEVRENHSFNIKNLEGFGYNQILKILVKLSQSRQFIGGQSNPTFLITSNEGKEIILKKKTTW